MAAAHAGENRRIISGLVLRCGLRRSRHAEKAGGSDGRRADGDSVQEIAPGDLAIHPQFAVLRGIRFQHDASLPVAGDDVAPSDVRKTPKTSAYWGCLSMRPFSSSACWMVLTPSGTPLARTIFATMSMVSFSLTLPGSVGGMVVRMRL